MAAATAAAKQAFIASSFLSPISNFGPTCSGMSSLFLFFLLFFFLFFWPSFLFSLVCWMPVAVCFVYLQFSSPPPRPFPHSCNAFQEVRRGRNREIGCRIEPKTFGADVTAVCFFSNFDVALCSQAICLHDAGRINRSVRSWRHRSSLSQCLSFGKHSLDFLLANRDHHSAAYKPLWRVCCDASTSTGFSASIIFCRFVSWRNIREPAFAPRLDFHPSHVGFAVAPATEDALSSQSSVRDVLGALSTIIDPDFGTDIVSCGFVKDLSIDNDSSQVQKTCGHFCNLFFCTVSPLQ